MPFIKLSSTLTFVLMLLTQRFTWAQGEAASKHRFRFYINEKEQPAAKANIFVVVAGDTIKGRQQEGFYYFPVIDTAKSFDIVVKVRNSTFSGQGYPAWMLNKGSRITFGRLTKLKHLASVADCNGLTEKDEGWAWYSKRFYVINRTYTIDIDDRDKIKELQFLIISPHNSNSHVTTQKITR